MSTSGSYEKFFRAEGKTYAHIMDPRTGYPAQGSVSVSVIAPRTLDSEAWAKPYFVNGRQWAAKHQAKGLSRVLLRRQDGYSHARGSNDKPFSGCLPAPADGRAAGVVHAAGRPVHEAVPGDSREARHSGNLQAARTWRPPSRCSPSKSWTWMRPSSSPTCCCPSNRWG